MSVLLALQCGSCNFSSSATASSESKLMEEFNETNGLKLPFTDKPVKLRLLTEGENTELNDTVFTRTLKELTGIELEIMVVPGSIMRQKTQIMFATKQLPDLFNNTLDRKEMEGYVQKGMITSFDENLDKLPNIKQLFFDDPAAREALAGATFNDGHVYYVSGYNIARDVNHGFLYRKDIFDKHQIKLWSNTDEFYSVLRKLKDIYPESTPFATKQQMRFLDNLSVGWGLQGRGFYFDEQSQSFLYGAVQPAFREMLDFVKRLYQEGLLDPDFLTCTENSWMIKMTKDNNAFVTYDWIDRMDLFYEQAKENIPDYDLRFAPPVGPKMVYQRQSKIGNANIAVSNNANRDFSLKLVDFLLSPAGAKLTTLGVEGETYVFDDSGTVKYLGFQPEELVNIRSLEKKYGLFTQSIALRYDDRCVYYQYTPKVREAQELVRQNQYLTAELVKEVGVKPEFRERYVELEYAIRVKADQFISRYIFESGDPEEIWTEWLRTTEELGIEEVTRLYNESKITF